MTPEQALEHKRRGGKLYEPVRFDPDLKHDGPLCVIHISATVQGGPGDDSDNIVIPVHHFRSK